MTRDESIVELGSWLQTPPGQYLLAWEQARVDHAVADAFGFHALQLGLPELDALRCNRMPHRWVASDSIHMQELLHAGGAWPASLHQRLPVDDEPAVPLSTQPAIDPIALHCEFDALPFPNNSVDLVVLPHALELARDPHQTLREVERVLVPEGRVVIAGFNPASLWGLRQRAGHIKRGIGLDRDKSLYLPRAGDFIGYWRLRDWLRLLSFDIESGRFGCWRPPCHTQQWLDRTAWMDRVGDRWWPVLGGVYFLVAVKRVRGMRLVGLARSERRKTAAAPAVVANRRPVARRRAAETADLD